MNKKLIILPLCSLFLCSCSNNTQDKSYQNEKSYKFIIKSIKEVRSYLILDNIIDTFEITDSCKYLFLDNHDACFFPIKITIKGDSVSYLNDIGFSFFENDKNFQRWLFGTVNYGNLDKTGYSSDPKSLYEQFESNNMWDSIYTKEQISEGLKAITY